MAGFGAAGARVFAICPQLPEHSARMESELGLGFWILRDADNVSATEFGLTLPTPPDVRAAESALGLDLPAHNGSQHSGSQHSGSRGWDLPMPARYVVDRGGKIVYASVQADHTRRRDPSEALAAVEELLR